MCKGAARFLTTEEMIMTEKKKSIKNEEICEGKQKLSIEELENVSGGGATVQVKADDIAKRNTTEAISALQGKAAGVVINTAGQPGAEMRVRFR